MFPQLNLGFLQVSSYSFFTVAALVAVVGGSYAFGIKRGFNRSELLWMLGGMSVAAFVGARLFNVLINFDWYLDDVARIFEFSSAGFSLYGGIISAIIAGGLISYFRKVHLMKFADTVTPFVGVGIGLQRVGCYLNGCCFGKETDLPWGVKFPPLSPAHVHQISDNILGSTSVHAVHPTEIYELIAALIGTAIAYYLIRRGKVDGTAFLVCGIYFSSFRWFNMQFRVLPYSESMLNFWYPALYLTVMILCLIVLLANQNRAVAVQNHQK